MVEDAEDKPYARFLEAMVESRGHVQEDQAGAVDGKCRHLPWCNTPLYGEDENQRQTSNTQSGTNPMRDRVGDLFSQWIKLEKLVDIRFLTFCHLLSLCLARMILR